MATQTLTQNPYSTVKKSTAPGSYNPPNPYKSVGMSKAPVNSYNKVVSPYSSVGVQAKSPQQNIVKPTNTLQNNQVKIATAPAPMDFTNQNSGLLAALSRQKAGIASDTDKKNLAYAQSRGWSGANYGTNPLADFNSSSNQSLTGNYKEPTDITSGGILSSLVDTSNQGNNYVNESAEGLYNLSQTNPGNSGQAYIDYQKSVDELGKLKSDIAAATASNESNPIPLEFQQGRQQVMDKKSALLLDAAQQKVNQKQQAIQNQITGAQTQQTGYNYAGSLGNTAQGLRQSGLQGAAQYAQPVQVPYSNQYINPQTGMPIGGGGFGGGGLVGGSLQSSVQNIAQRVLNGSMGYDAGVQALSAYGQAGINGLLQALGPNFNVQQSNARAQAQGASTLQTGTTGGVITKSADSANKALNSLQLAFNKLSKLQTGGIPATNNIANWIAQQFGQGALSSYNSILHDARAQLSGVLTSTGAVSPTGAEAMAQAYLPDNMTPTMFKNKLKAARDLIAQKVSAFTNTSSGNQNYNSGGGGLWNW